MAKKKTVAKKSAKKKAAKKSKKASRKNSKKAAAKKPLESAAKKPKKSTAKKPKASRKAQAAKKKTGKNSVSSVSGEDALKALKKMQINVGANTSARKKEKAKKAKPQPHYKTTADFLKEKNANWLAFVEKRNTAEEVFRKYQDVIMKHPDVTGAHVGVKRVQVESGDTVKQLVAKPLTFAICIHVRKKLEDKSKCSWPLPEHFDGVPTDVVEGEFQRMNGLMPSDTQEDEVAEMEGGVAIGIQNSSEFGTMGYVVTAGSFELYLTNEHVAPMGSEIVQPPATNRVIGKTIQVNKALDAALVQPNGVVTSAKTIIGLTGVAPEFISKGVLGVPDENKTVLIIGAATDVTEGEIESISGHVTVKDQGEFQNQILVDSKDGAAITDKGNSGGLVVIKRQRGSLIFYEIVGLVHALANNGQRAIANPIQEIVNRFGIELN